MGRRGLTYIPLTALRSGFRQIAVSSHPDSVTRIITTCELKVLTGFTYLVALYFALFIPFPEPYISHASKRADKKLTSIFGCAGSSLSAKSMLTVLLRSMLSNCLGFMSPNRHRDPLPSLCAWCYNSARLNVRGSLFGY